MNDALIMDCIRTPRGRGKESGSLYEVKPISLVADLLKALTSRNNLDSQAISDVILGCVTQTGEQGMNLARASALLAGYDHRVAGMTINRFCASGLEAINSAAAKIQLCDELLVAGGVESMSRTPMGSDLGPLAGDPETNLTAHFVPQGISADLIATINDFDRAQLDAFALLSHQRASHAQRHGFFTRSLLPVKDKNGLMILDRDETIRHDPNLSALTALPPSFASLGEAGFDAVAKKRYYNLERINHVHTAGNSSGIVDGAALSLIGSETSAKRFNLTPRARIVATAVVGSEPIMMLTGTVNATLQALERARLTIDDIDLFEVNEAFASVVLYFARQTNVPMEKINVNGGAIALGHPLGATGAILIGTLLDELERRNGRYGIVTLCAGAGMGIATVIERI